MCNPSVVSRREVESELKSAVCTVCTHAARPFPIQKSFNSFLLGTTAVAYFAFSTSCSVALEARQFAVLLVARLRAAIFLVASSPMLRLMHPLLRRRHLSGASRLNWIVLRPDLRFKLVRSQF